MLAACSSTEPGPTLPVEAPGTRLKLPSPPCPNLSRDYGQCIAWSSDGLTLFVVIARGADTALAGVDVVAELTPPAPLLGAFTVIFPIGRSLNLATSRDSRTIFFTRPDTVGPLPFEVMRMSLVDGKITRVAPAGAPDISVAPDGTALAIHTFQSATIDTVALLDVASGLRRAVTVGFGSLLRGFSPDGRDVAMRALFGDSAIVWHSATGERQSVRYGDDFNPGVGLRHTRDVQWTNGGFSTLYQASNGALAEISVATGAEISYGQHKRGKTSFAWLPAISRVFSAEDVGVCYLDSSCYRALYHSSLLVSSPTGIRTIGSVNTGLLSTGVDGNSFSQFAPSPDGRWLAYAVGGDPFILPAGP